MNAQNTATQVAHDRPEQLKFVQSGLLADEQLHGVFDCKGTGTGFLALTDRRVILEDRSFVGKKIALTSIPYSRIASVAILTNKSMFGTFFSSGELHITTVGGGHDFILWQLRPAS